MLFRWVERAIGYSFEVANGSVFHCYGPFLTSGSKVDMYFFVTDKVANGVRIVRLSNQTEFLPVFGLPTNGVATSPVSQNLSLTRPDRLLYGQRRTKNEQCRCRKTDVSVLK